MSEIRSKYVFTGEKIKTPSGHILYRIQAIKDFANVIHGDLGRIR